MSGQTQVMETWRNLGQKALAALICLSVVVWSVMPVATHAPTMLETLQDHAEMIADHGHSHGLEEDLFWAIHGHSHDAVDHDHSQAFLPLDDGSQPTAGSRDAWRLRSSQQIADRNFRIERPPRA